jgi:hypothetical protein
MLCFTKIALSIKFVELNLNQINEHDLTDNALARLIPNVNMIPNMHKTMLILKRYSGLTFINLTPQQLMHHELNCFVPSD